MSALRNEEQPFDEPPHDLLAEQALVGAVLDEPRLIDKLDVRPSDFYSPAHEIIWTTMLRLWRAGQLPDPVSVAHELATPDLRRQTGGAPYLHSCMAAFPVVGSPQHYVTIVCELATRRRTITALLTALGIARQGADSEEVLERAEKLLAAVPSKESGDVDTLMPIDDFIDRDLGPIQWVIPGLLQREERCIITAGEGLGKSTLIRQLAACAASGVAPFSGRPFTPVKALVIDCENPERIMQDRWGEIRQAIRNHSRNPGANLWVDRRPGGLNLAEPADRRWLSRRIEAVQPDLLAIGPAYKLYIGGSRDRDEDIARMVTAYLDEIRTRVGCAILLEHHSAKQKEGAKRTVEPFGSSLWMRWPEFGMGLQAVTDDPMGPARRLVDVKQWRGPRDERPWPRRLETGGRGLPWIESSAI